MAVVWEIIVVLLFGLHVMSQAVTGQTCPAVNKCKQHTLKNGTNKCCLVVKCPPGTYTTLCDFGNCKEEARCLPCDSGSYQSREFASDDNIVCSRKSGCSERLNLVTDVEGDATTDRTCKCDILNGFYKLSPLNKYCNGPMGCPPGHELNTTGTCIPCLYYQFKPDNTTGRCRLKTDCGGADKYAFKSEHDSTKDNVCLNITMPPLGVLTTPIALPIQEGNGRGDGGLSGEHKAMIGGCVAGISAIVIIVILVVIIRRRRREHEESASDLPEKPRPPEDSDTDSGNGSFHRQNSTDSDCVSKYLLRDNPKLQGGSERPRIHIPPQRQGSEKSNLSIKTPDSGIVCSTPGPGGLAYDVEMDSEPAPSPGLKENCPLQTKDSVPSGRTIIQVNGPNCTVHVGDKKTIIHHSREALNDDETYGDNTEYEVQEAECS